MLPVQKMRWNGLLMVSSSAAVATTILNVEHAELAAERVHLDLLPAVLTVQTIFPVFLEPVLPDRVAHLVPGKPRELVDVDLADVAEQMSGHRAVEIVAARADLHRHAGKF